jgi:serine/threonine protein kinase
LKKEKLTNEKYLNRRSYKTEIFKAKYDEVEVISKKISLEDKDKLLRGRIKKREILLMCQLCNKDNPNLVKFYGWIEESEYIKIIMEYLASDLTKYIGEYNVDYYLSEKQKAKILLDVSKGLKFIHKKEVVYRDLKSGNVFLDKKITDDTLDFTAKIFDFGFSKRFEDINDEEPNTDEFSGMTANAGTQKYFAPEQSLSNYDYKVDIFAFAMMAYELFSERFCYSEHRTKNLNDSKLMIEVGKGLRPNRYGYNASKVPSEILNMCENNWEGDPDDRQTAEELLDTMEEIYELYDYI